MREENADDLADFFPWSLFTIILWYAKNALNYVDGKCMRIQFAQWL